MNQLYQVGRELGIEEQDINLIITEYPDNHGQQAMVMLRLAPRQLGAAGYDHVHAWIYKIFCYTYAY